MIFIYLSIFKLCFLKICAIFKIIFLHVCLRQSNAETQENHQGLQVCSYKPQTKLSIRLIPTNYTYQLCPFFFLGEGGSVVARLWRFICRFVTFFSFSEQIVFRGQYAKAWIHLNKDDLSDHSVSSLTQESVSKIPE